MTKSPADPSEVYKFDQLAEEWWRPTGAFKALHQINPVRLHFIRDQVIRHFGEPSESRFPLAGYTILDIGCGGGLLTEPLSRLGGHVTGIDASTHAISIAQTHAQNHLSLSLQERLTYEVSTAEAYAGLNKTFDIVLCLELIEHVPHDLPFLEACTALLKPGGLFILSTLNRTLKSFMFAIVGAEYILRWIPKGTHQWHTFRRPSEIISILRRYQVEPVSVSGVTYHPLTRTWRITSDLSVNYILSATKGAGDGPEGEKPTSEPWKSS